MGVGGGGRVVGGLRGWVAGVNEFFYYESKLNFFVV